MKTLLTHGYFIQNDLREKILMKPYPPSGLLYLSAWLTREGISNKIYDTTFSSPSDLQEELVNTVPDVIGIYSTLMTKKRVLEIISFIRNHDHLMNMKIIVGGPDTRHNAENYLASGADIIIPGEAEIPLASAIKAIEKNKDLSDINGLIFLKEGKVFCTDDQKPLIMDSLPFPARESIDVWRYFGEWRKKHGYSSLNISTMRGCPYSCNWCSKSVFGNTYRRRDPALVAEEMIRIKDLYNPDQLWFTDDVFTINKEWLRRFAEQLKLKQVHIPYECISRSDCIDDEIVELLRQTGCRKLWIGAESGSQKVIDLMNRKIKISVTINVLKKVKEAGISTGTFIMSGYPGEKKKDIYETAGYIKRTKPDELTVGLAYPIKGTAFFNQVESTFKEPFDWKNSNEREIRFSKPYSERFYRFTLRYLFNTYLSGTKTNIIKRTGYFLKAFIARTYIFVSH